MLVDHFIGKFAAKAPREVDGIEPDALGLLLRHPWPGNVRELEHIIERAVLLGRNATLGIDDLPPQFRAGEQRTPPLAGALARGFTLRELEQEYIERVLENTAGNKSEAAKILGVDRTTLYRKLEEFKLKS